MESHLLDRIPAGFLIQNEKLVPKSVGKCMGPRAGETI